MVRALLCSFTRCMRDLLVWPKYTLGQVEQGMQYTMTDLCSGGRESFILTKALHRVWAGLKLVLTWSGARIHLTASDTPLMYT